MKKNIGCILEPAIGFVLILLSLWMMVSCKTVRQAERIEQQTVCYSKSEIGKTYHGIEQHELLRSIWKEVRIGSTIESQIVVYDTSIEKDSITGKHPVLAEITATSKTDIESSIEDSIKNATVRGSVVDTQIQSTTHQTEAMAAKTEKISKPKALWLDWMTIFFIVIAIILSFKYYNKN